jgi:hypothetical protein
VGNDFFIGLPPSSFASQTVTEEKKVFTNDLSHDLNVETIRASELKILFLFSRSEFE